MRKIMVLMLLVATVALSMGAALPRLPTLQPGPDPVSDQSSTDSHNQPSEGVVLGISSPGEGNWMFNDENNEKYNENVNKMQGVNDHNFEPAEDEWLGYQKQYYQPQDLTRDYLYDGDSNAHDLEQKSGYESLHPTTDAIYSQNKDILVRNGQAYYLYDTHMAAKSPFDYVINRQNCLYKAMLRSSSGNAQPPKVDKRDVEGIGDLMVENEDKRKVQKRLFSYLSRLMPMEHKDRQVPTLRYPAVVYVPDVMQDGRLTAVTRASHHHPTGQFVRWG